MVTVRSGVFLEAVFWIFEEGAALFHGSHRLWGFGEGLGGGYCTPSQSKAVCADRTHRWGIREAETLFCCDAVDSFSRARVHRRYYLK